MTFDESMANEWAREPIADRETDIRLSFYQLELLNELTALAGSPDKTDALDAIADLKAKIAAGQNSIREQMKHAACASSES
jgi:hypothetical protein